MSTPNTSPLVHTSKKRGIKSFAGFTLVELIIVITILVILGTMAFVSLSGFSGSARDSSRVSDLSLISKGLSVTLARNGTYPDPTAWTGITYSGGVVWKQGTMGDGVISQISGFWVRMSKKPVDPLSSTEYVYSITTESKEYSLKADYEGSKVGWNTPSSAYADTGNPTIAYIAGNYNGIATKVTVGSPKTVYLIAIPNIVTPTSVTGITIGSNQNFILNGSSNASGVTFSPKVIYQSGALPSNDTEKVLFASGVISAYSGTSLSSTPNVSQFITNASSTGTLATVWGGVVNMVWGGGSVASVVSATSATNGVCGSASGAILLNNSTITWSVACQQGSLSGSVTGTGPWGWTCAGSNGGIAMNCSATKDTYTVLLLHGDGINNSTTIPDGGINNYTANPSGWSVAISTSTGVFGGASIYIPSDGNYLSIPDSNDWNFGTWDFTVEAWMNLTATNQASNEIVGQGPGCSFAGGCWLLWWQPSGWVNGLMFYVGVNNVNVLQLGDNTPGAYQANVWYHIAVTRSGNTFTLYKNGTAVASTTANITMPDVPQPLHIGSIWTPTAARYIDEVRISKGIARTFVAAPTAPY